MNLRKIFDAHGLEAARMAARGSGSGKICAQFLALERELNGGKTKLNPKPLKQSPRRAGKTARKLEALRAGSRGVAPTNVGNPREKGSSGGKPEIRSNPERATKRARKLAQRK